MNKERTIRMGLSGGEKEESREGEDGKKGNECKIRKQDREGSLSIHRLKTETPKYSA